MPPSEDIFDLMIRMYCDLGNTKEINYYTFCRDIDRPEDIFPEYKPKRPQPEAKSIMG